MSNGNGSGKPDPRPELTPAEIIKIAALIAYLNAIIKKLGKSK